MASTKTKVNMSRRPWNVLPDAVGSLVLAIMMSVNVNSLLVNAFWWLATAGFILFFARFWVHNDAVARNLALATIGLMGVALTLAVPSMLELVQTRPSLYQLLPIITLRLGIMFAEAILMVLPNLPRIVRILSNFGWLIFLAVFIISIIDGLPLAGTLFGILIVLIIGIPLIVYTYYLDKASKKEKSKE